MNRIWDGFGWRYIVSFVCVDSANNCAVSFSLLWAGQPSLVQPTSIFLKHSTSDLLISSTGKKNQTVSRAGTGSNANLNKKQKLPPLNFKLPTLLIFGTFSHLPPPALMIGIGWKSHWVAEWCTGWFSKRVTVWKAVGAFSFSVMNGSFPSFE